VGSIAREIISAFLASIYKKKVVVHFRCTLPNMVSGKLHLFVLKLLAWLSDEFIVLNQKSSDFLLKKLPKIKYEVIPNFINETELNPNRICAEKISTVLYVGGVIPEKGSDIIIDVARQIPKIQFRLVGKIGINVDEIPSNVFLLGEQNQHFVHEELLNADVFVFPSKFSGEGFSNALAEAMASGLPCIVSDWAANADMIENCKGGVVLRECTADNMVKALESLKTSKIRQEYADFNKKKVESEYLEKIVVSRYILCYEKLMEA
jgi:glycosyltransferase involved in cell wall biosynthesis